jgi:glucose-6-phosphate isomerase
MNMSKQQSWERFKKYYFEFPKLGLAVDLSRMNVSDEFFATMEPRIQKAFVDMAALENGAIANPDEGRMVGHYWLRNPALAPSPEITREIEETIARVKTFVADVDSGVIRGAKGIFKNLLLIGIGGSALGPQFVAHALGHPLRDNLRIYFFDNTDPDGMHSVLATIGPELGQTLCLVISKSGGTKETRNGMLEAKAAYEVSGFDFGKHAIAVTRKESELDRYSSQNGWIGKFPMWDWVGGRTSEMSAVGLLPAALQGIDIDGILAGARACDEVTRVSTLKKNPSALLALAWFRAGDGKGNKNMVIIPYKDRLELFGRYLQQLIMESLGKERDLSGTVVNQGICVFGNKGSTDQHSYIQQLRDGLNNFFVTFVEVLVDHEGKPLFVKPNVTSGDYLHGFYLGTRQALAENGRESITLTIRDISAFQVGVLIALFERAVGYYASLVNVNAYHQPGVEAGKKAAETILELQRRILICLSKNPESPMTVQEIVVSLNAEDDFEHVFKVCEHLSSNPSHRVAKSITDEPFQSKYSKV